MNGRYFPHRLILIISNNVLLPFINDITRQKVESSHDIAINPIDQ